MASASNTQFKVENGLLVVGGNANLDVNTTITSTLTATANVIVSGNVVSNLMPYADDTYYLGNTSNRWIVHGSSVYANTLYSNTVSATTNVYITGTAANFNALSGVNSGTDTITTTASHGFGVGEYVQYLVAAGNTAIGGLTNASLYYVGTAPSGTTLTLSTAPGGSAINITAGGVSETGHTLTPIKIILSPNGSITMPPAFKTNTWSGTSTADGGYTLNLTNSTATYAGLFINNSKFEYKSGNVAHAGNFGIYNVSGTRVGP